MWHQHDGRLRPVAQRWGRAADHAARSVAFAMSPACQSVGPKVVSLVVVADSGEDDSDCTC
eukprot:575352-Alexandrium_andersonii.AAC.1